VTGAAETPDRAPAIAGAAQGRKAMPSFPVVAIAALGLAGMIASSPGPRAAAAVIDFEAPAIVGATADIAGDVFAAQGVAFRTVRLSGTVTVGASVTLSPIVDGLRIYRDASAISGQQGAGPAQGGAYNDLLMRFDRLVSSVALASDDMVETPHPIRLVALAAADGVDRFRVVDFIEAMDDALAAPANLLALAPSEPFEFALFEVRSQQEAFDDLSFAFAAAVPGPSQPPSDSRPDPQQPAPGGMDVPAPSSLAMLMGVIGGAAASRRRPLSPAA
jgi:hypothetical protein